MICAERDEGIGRCAAVHAGVQIGVCAADFDLGVDHAAQADAERGKAGREELGVGDEREVGFEIGGLGGDVGGNSLPSHFFFAFEEDADVERQLAVVGEQRFESLDLRPDLALVVDGAAGVEIAVALGGLEGRREPLVERIGGLDVVVAVDEHGGFARQRAASRRRPADGLAVSMRRTFSMPMRLSSAASKFGGAAAIVLVLGQRGDGRNAQQVFQFIEKTRMILRGESQQQVEDMKWLL